MRNPRAVAIGDTLCRQAVVSEQKALLGLQRRASLSNAGDCDALLVNPDAIEVPLSQIANGQVIVAERDGVMRVLPTVLPREDGGTELDALFVEPSLWKQGIGRLLVEQCASAARSTGSATLHVVGNPHAEGFYHACGFDRSGPSAPGLVSACPSDERSSCGTSSEIANRGPTPSGPGSASPIPAWP